MAERLKPLGRVGGVTVIDPELTLRSLRKQSLINKEAAARIASTGDSVSFPRPTSTALPMLFAGAAVTLYAILDVPNALLLVLGPHPVRLMFVAPVTRIATEVVVDVTRRTGRIVVAVQNKELLVVECGGLPMRRAVASRAAVLDLTVQRVSGRFVTSLAAIQY